MGGVFMLWNVVGHWEREGTDSPYSTVHGAAKPSDPAWRCLNGHVVGWKRSEGRATRGA